MGIAEAFRYDLLVEVVGPENILDTFHEAVAQSNLSATKIGININTDSPEKSAALYACNHHGPHGPMFDKLQEIVRTLKGAKVRRDPNVSQFQIIM